MPNWIKGYAAPVAAAAAVATALLTALHFFVAVPLHKLFDTQDKHILLRIDDMIRQMNHRFEAVDQRLDRHGPKREPPLRRREPTPR